MSVLFIFSFSKIATKPNRPWSNWHLKLLQLTIRLNDRGKERFRETLVELSIETNFDFLKMNFKQVQKYSWPTDWTLVLVLCRFVVDPDCRISFSFLSIYLTLHFAKKPQNLYSTENYITCCALVWVSHFAKEIDGSSGTYTTYFIMNKRATFFPNEEWHSKRKRKLTG